MCYSVDKTQIQVAGTKFILKLSLQPTTMHVV